MMKINYKLYWEDIAERLIFAELDDYAWKLPEKIFDYKKKNSLYIFHNGKLGAYYSLNDSKKEAKAGYRYYSQGKNINKTIHLKKETLEQVKNCTKNLAKIKIKKLSDQELKVITLETLALFGKALGVHYLTQPQFFEKFEKRNRKLPKTTINRISQARFNYTRLAWTKAMAWCRILLKEFGRRLKLNPKQMESLFCHEIRNSNFDRKNITSRINKFAFISTNHKIRLFTDKAVDKFIKKYEQYKNLNSAKGIVGNKGIYKGKAFVLKNDFLDFSRLPKGMKRGMVLIIQNAWPELSRYYRLASALITNEGGITSHGVVVAREFDIPCIVGTKIATKIFKTGDRVLADANKGLVKKIR